MTGGPSKPARPRAEIWLRAAIAVSAAAVAIVGVLFFGWPAVTLLVLYWAENVFIGIATICRIMLVGLRRGGWGVVGGLFRSAFFLIHYGAFTFSHLALIVLVLQPRQPALENRAEQAAAFDPVALLERDGPMLALALVTMAASVLVDLVRWVRATRPPFDPASAEPGIVTNPDVLMFAPYGRIVLLHLTLGASFYFMSRVDAPVLAAMLLVGLKLTFDLLGLKGPIVRFTQPH